MVTTGGHEGASALVTLDAAGRVGSVHVPTRTHGDREVPTRPTAAGVDALLRGEMLAGTQRR